MTTRVNKTRNTVYYCLFGYFYFLAGRPTRLFFNLIALSITRIEAYFLLVLGMSSSHNFPILLNGLEQ